MQCYDKNMSVYANSWIKLQTKPIEQALPAEHVLQFSPVARFTNMD